jgi:hypothetical protein
VRLYDKGYIKIYSTHKAFAALKANGSITTWGSLDNSWNEIKNKTTNAPTDKGYTAIYSNAYAFTAVKPDGSIKTRGALGYGGAYASGYNLALGKPALIEPSVLRAAKATAFEQISV